MAHLKQYCARAAAWPLAVALAPSRYDGRAFGSDCILQHNATSWDNGCQKPPLLTPFLTPLASSVAAGKLCGSWYSVAVDKL